MFAPVPREWLFERWGDIYTRSSRVADCRDEAVDSPAGSNIALLFGIHLYRDVYAMARKGELPCINVGTGWAIWSAMCLYTATYQPKQEV